jgi:hypothetical protein
VIDVLPGEVCLEEAGDEAESDTVLGDMFFGQRAETFRARLKLDNEQSSRFGQFLSVLLTPFTQVSENVGQKVFFQWFLKVLVSLNYAFKYFDHSLDSIPITLGLEQVDGRSLIIEIRSSWLEQTTDE